MGDIASWVTQSIRRAGWAPILVFVVHVVVSKVFGAYLAVPSLDVPMHGLGGVAIAYFFWCALGLDEARAVVGELSRLGVALFTIASVGSAAVVWEFAEWSSDYLGLTHAQAGLDDTMLDMALGIGGGLAFLLVRSLRR